MKFNKTLAKTLVFALAISFAPSFGTTAKAAAPTVNFSAANQEVSSNADFYWGTVKKLKKEKGSNLKIGSDFYKVENIEKAVDKKLNLSNMKFSKDTLLAFGSTASPSAEEWKVQKFPAEENTLKVYYGLSKDFGKFKGDANTFGNTEVGYIGASIGKKNLTEVAATDLEVHNGNGVWADFVTYFGAASDEKVGAKLKGLIQTGTTLTFRKKGADASFTVNSKEAKLKIPAQAAGPKVAVKDGKTGLKKGLEYIVKEAGQAMGTQWTDVSDEATVKFVDQVFTDKSKNYDFYVRIKAKGKKGASKYTKLLVSRAAKPEVPSADEDTLIGDTGAENLVKDTENGEFKVGLKTKLAYDISKGAELTNSSDKDYEVYLSFDGSAPANDAKWLSLKAAKNPEKPTKLNLKYSTTKKPNTYAGDKSSKLYVRRPAKKQVGNAVVLASDALGFAFKVANVAQAAEFEADTSVQVKVNDSDKWKATLHKVPVGAAETYTFRIKATNLVKTGAKPKVKFVNLNGVKVTIDAFEDNMKANITVSITDKAFPQESDIAGKKVTFTLNYEGIKDKAFEISFDKEPKS